MLPFDFARAHDIPGAIKSATRQGTKFIAGGTNLVDLMKCDVERPAHLVDVNDLPLATVEQVSGGIRIGALARMSDVAAHPLVLQNFPVVSQALLNSASPQIRIHAILGTSDSCIATHPSDLAVAVAALDAVITLRGPNGERQVAATDFHLLPGNTPDVEHDLKHGELIM